ncbi:MAG: DoxX family protein [Blastocatellia bacterium]|nr:DoxX family protein [Blastocatellia bacterium]
MSSTTSDASISNGQRWGSRILIGLSALFLIADAAGKLGRLAPVIEATTKLGFPDHLIQPIGAVLLIGAIVYLIPRTSVLGVILLTGYLGGAVATHVRAGSDWFPILFPVAIGVLLWGGLYLGDRRLHSLLPLTTTAPAASGKMLWAGRILSALPTLLLIFSGVMKLMKPAPVLEGFAKFGYQEHSLLGIAIVELACAALYLIPQTAVLGAILLTGYLGGATMTHLRIGDPFLMTVVVGVALWGGLHLRDERLRALLPLRS